MPKFVVVSGGVVSGLGKGITASSVGLLLKESGLTVTCIKIDPYLNIDAGTMSPYEHGEVYVLDDGGEVDLDLGNYERFLDIQLTRDHNITTGKIYDLVLKQERKGSYLGKTVQVVPHITDAIQDWISRVSRIPIDGTGKVPDVCIIELGGTVGDIESMIFLEALRQFEFRVGRDNFCHIHVSLVPIVGAVGEQKSKPAQHSVKELRAAGLLPNMIVCRSTNPLERSVKEKISMFGMVPSNHVFSVHDVGNIYEVPSMLLEQNLPALVLSTLRINIMPPATLPVWNEIATKASELVKGAIAARHQPDDIVVISTWSKSPVESIKKRGIATNEEFPEVKIGIVGKYTGLSDSYISVTKALRVAALASNRTLKIVWINAEHLEDHRHSRRTSSRPSSSSSTTSRQARRPTHKNDEFRKAWRDLSQVDGILCPGGFGDRATEGKLLAVKYARQKNVPYLGICLGMQMAVVEFARNVLNMRGANSTEFDPDTKHPTVIFMPEISPNEMGGNMRLGSRMTRLKSDSIICALYDEQKEIYERHRHRYEVNPELVEQFEAKGMRFSGQDELGVRMEVVEIPKHKYFVGTQFHPEFKSRPFRPSPPFCGLIRAAAGLPVTDTHSEVDIADSLSNLSLKSKLNGGDDAACPSSPFSNGDHFPSPADMAAQVENASTSDAESEASEERHQLDDLIDSVISDGVAAAAPNGIANGVSPKSVPSA